jgi:hypothetical protein
VSEEPSESAEPSESEYISSARPIDGGAGELPSAQPTDTAKPEDNNPSDEGGGGETPPDPPQSPVEPGDSEIPPSEPDTDEKPSPPEAPGEPPAEPPANSGARAGFVDPECTRTKMTFNDGFGTSWLAEGKGLVGFWIYANFDVYDQCDHGGISGSFAVYDANVKAKGGKVHVMPNYVAYNRSGISGWQYDNPRAYKWAENNGWTWYYVVTNNNIGMTRSTYFDYIKVSAYITFDNVPGAARRETCSRSGNDWQCKGHMGL